MGLRDAAGAAATFDWAAFWGLLAVVVAVVGIAITFVTYRKQFPKRRLVFRAQATPLLAAHPVAAQLAVSYQGTPLTNPHLVRVVIRSSSRADIASKAFDDERPIRFQITPAPFVLSETDSSDKTIGITWSSNSGFVGAGDALIAPQLIRRHAEGEFIAITDGPPEINPENSLIDISLVKVARSDARAQLPVTLLVAVTLALVATGAALRFFVETFYSGTSWGGFFSDVLLGMFTAYAVLLGASVVVRHRNKQRDA
ncbi:hypothetical protein ACPW96_22720 [Micromonospora sp. DT81.3]|uniref:hypothetical protein n=1 Tax=Micromonospora sp. DT81.3 TaxID=3416523 RepID=UPI003CF6F0DD